MSVLEKIISLFFEKTKKPHRLTPFDSRVGRIIRITSEVTGVPEIELLSKRRQFSSERQIAMYLSVKLLGLSYPEVGRAFGRDHTTVIYSVRKIENRGRGRTKVNRCLKKITSKLSAT